MKKSVMCIVDTQARAESIVNDVERAGFSRDDVSVLLPSKSGTKDFAHEHSTKAPEGAVAGVGAGGVSAVRSVFSRASAHWRFPVWGR